MSSVGFPPPEPGVDDEFLDATNSLIIVHVYREVKDVTEWFFLALLLGISDGEYDKIQKTEQDEKSKQRAIIKAWLNTGNASWARLAAALRDDAVGHAAIANNIAKKFPLKKNPSLTEIDGKMGSLNVATAGGGIQPPPYNPGYSNQQGNFMPPSNQQNIPPPNIGFHGYNQPPYNASQPPYNTTQPPYNAYQPPPYQAEPNNPPAHVPTPADSGPKLVPDWYGSAGAARRINAPCIRTMSGFSKSSTQPWFSVPFYTGAGGYNLRLKVECSNYLSVGVCVAEGDNDDVLRWPFRGTLKVKLLNWTEDENHFEHTFSVTSATDPGKSFMRVVAGGSLGEMSNKKFISTSQLDYRQQFNTQFLSNGNLCFEITDVEVEEGYQTSLTPSWVHSQLSTCDYGVVPVFRTVESFKQNKENSREVIVDPFYTERGGFKMSMSVYPNGDGSNKGKSITVFLRLMRGENDDKLTFPINGVFNVQLLNWEKDSDHSGYSVAFDESISMDLRTAVSIGEKRNGTGYYKFVGHDTLFDFTNRKLLNNDMLCFKIDYFEHVPQTDKSPVPHWSTTKLYQSNVIPCMRTVVGYKAYKITNRIWRSDPFYTTERGYKLQLVVTANGYNQYKGKYSFVGICLMKGEYDDKLVWPMKITVTVELQNWCSDGNHIRKVVNHHKAELKLRDRVVGKDVIRAETSFGHNDFCSHAQLEFPDSQYINYLDSDRLCFKIIRYDWVN